MYGNSYSNEPNAFRKFIGRKLTKHRLQDGTGYGYSNRYGDLVTTSPLRAFIINWSGMAAFIAACFMVIILTVVLPMSFDRVVTPAGTQTVVVDTPLFFGDGGVRPEVLQPGAEWIWSTTRRISVDPKPFNQPVKINDFMSADNNPLDFETNITLQVTDWPKMVTEFGEQWWESNLERPYVSAVRQEVKGHSMAVLLSDVNAAASIDNNLTTKLTEIIEQKGMPVRVIEISMGRAMPDAKVNDEMIATAVAQQRVVTHQKEKLAEDEREKSEKQRAVADNAYRNQIGLSVSEFVQLRQVDALVKACELAKECVLVPPGTAVVR